MRHPLRLLLSLLLLLTACAAPRGGPASAGTITVLAAASLNEAFQEIGQRMEAEHPGVKIEFNFAGSQQLSQQISLGAPADVFASANDAQMAAAVKTGRVGAGAQRTFAHNRLVVIIPRANPGRIDALNDLSRPGLRLVFAAQQVPAGQYSLEFLEKASRQAAFGGDYKDNVLRNVMSYEDNVRAVLTKVALGEADAGIVYSSDAAGAAASSIRQIPIPGDLNVIVSYPIAPLSDSRNPALAQAFIDLVLSDTGQAILEKYGFLSAQAGQD